GKGGAQRLELLISFIERPVDLDSAIRRRGLGQPYRHYGRGRSPAQAVDLPLGVLQLALQIGDLLFQVGELRTRCYRGGRRREWRAALTELQSNTGHHQQDGCDRAAINELPRPRHWDDFWG